MKLSEAILLGSMFRPPVRHEFVAPAGSCALGAAGEALGVPVPRLVPETFVSAWPRVSRTVRCPACDERLLPVVWAIIELNDRHQWTRPQIAAWVAELERGEDAMDFEPAGAALRSARK
jgi:hypothetical protein